MATYNSVNNSKTLSEPTVKIDNSEDKGRMRVIHDSYAAATLTNDYIVLGEVPDSFKFIELKVDGGTWSLVSLDSAGSESGTISDIGDSLPQGDRLALKDGAGSASVKAAVIFSAANS